MIRVREMYDSEAKLSWILAALAGLLGATAFTHSAGYFVTFMTGNAQRAVLGFFRDEHWLAVSAAMLILAFLAGVVSASPSRRYIWPTRPHGATVLTTLALALATVLDITVGGGPAVPLPFLPTTPMPRGANTPAPVSARMRGHLWSPSYFAVCY